MKDGYTHCQHGSKDWCQSYLNSAHDYIEALEAELQKARESLEPFAVRPGKLDGLWKDQETNWGAEYGSTKITVGDLRHASKVFRALSQDKER